MEFFTVQNMIWMVSVYAIGLLVTIPISIRGYLDDLKWVRSDKNKVTEARIDWLAYAFLWPLVLLYALGYLAGRAFKHVQEKL